MARVILAWGRAGDGSVRAVREALARRGRTGDLVLVDQRRYAAITAATSTHDRALRGWVEVDGRRIDLDDVSGLLVRPYPPAQQEAGPVSGQRTVALDALMMAIADYGPAHIAVVNRPSAMAGNDSKPAQGVAIAVGWFPVPPTVVTNERAVAEAFWAEHGDVVYKSTSAVRSIAARLTPAHRARLDRLFTCPTQFQAYVPGVEYRVHVVGDDLFTVQVRSQAVDYRYAAREGMPRVMAAATLPDAVAGRCVDLTRHLGLAVSGIDLRQTPDGAWYCFEVNTSPAFSWFEEHTRLPIADAVTSLLLAGA